MSTLYVVATPIGNLEDITLRALRVFKEVDYILCEDTRVTKKLLAKYDILIPTLSYHAHSSQREHERIIELLEEGRNLALVSDAGTPTISDPGSRIIEQVRTALPDVAIVAVPGPCALTAALSISGIPASEFLFLGFVPHKKGREKFFKEALESTRPVVFYESPHRILKALASMEKLDPKRRLVIGRELTKLHEEVLSGTVPELITLLTSDPKRQKGEFVVIVTPHRKMT
jgi:16S rRNA (cytidine1402-2'-O)-methyltransferase